MTSERLSLRHQDQLHRILVDGIFCPVGADEEVRVDLRVIATTNADLRAAIAGGRFKPDFLSRLNYFELQMPGLEDRLDDIPALCEALLFRNLEDSVSKGIDCPRELRFDPSCWPVIQALRFEDHVRGLEKLIARLIVLGEGQVIMPLDIAHVWPQAEFQVPKDHPRTLRTVRDDAERLHIAQVWKIGDFNVAYAARELGITARSLYTKLKRYGITRSTA